MKKYECMECGLKQKIKDARLVLKPREGHMTDSIYGPCAKCRSLEPMIPLSQG